MVERVKKISGWDRRKARVRKKITGSSSRPRLNVYRSNTHIYAQIIDDASGNSRTMLTASTLSPEIRGDVSGMKKVDAAKKVGELIGKLAIEKGIKSVVFDRSGYLYHGRVKAVAEGARSAGLEF